MCVKGFVRGAIAGVVATAVVAAVLWRRRKNALGRQTLVGKPSSCCCNNTSGKDSFSVVPGTDKCSVCEFRRLWIEHVFWTREVAMLIFSNHKMMADVSTETLIQNQQNIAAWLAKALKDPSLQKPIYSVLKEHIEIAGSIIAALKAGRDADTQKGIAAWRVNGNQIAATLFAVSQKHSLGWKLPELTAMMRLHLDLTVQQLLALRAALNANGGITDYSQASLKAFVAGETHVVAMADALVAPIKCK